MTHYQRKWWLKVGYGITPEFYNALYANQGGCCAICGRHQSEFKRRLAVDHDHETGAVRGLLCIRCNIAVGEWFDNKDRFAFVQNYIKNDKVVELSTTLDEFD